MGKLGIPLSVILIPSTFFCSFYKIGTVVSLRDLYILQSDNVFTFRIVHKHLYEKLNSLPGILLKFRRDIEERILCSTLWPFSKLSFSREMRAEKADSWKSTSGNEASEELNQATVVRQTLTTSKFPEPKHIETVSKNDFRPSPRSEADKFLNHSSLASSSSASYIFYDQIKSYTGNLNRLYICIGNFYPLH